MPTFREIWLFYGFTPNHGKNPFYYSTNIRNYIAMLERYEGRKRVVDSDNYRMQNTNTLSVVTDTGIPFDVATYACEVTYTTPPVGEQVRTYYELRAYHVLNAYEKGGYSFYTLQPDLWGTYACRASITDLHVKRCNKDFGGGGVFDLPKNTEKSPVIAFWHAANNRMNLGEVSLVMKLRTIASQNIFGQDVVTTDYMVEMTLQEVLNCYKDGDNWRILNRDTIVDLAARLCAGVHSTATLSSLVNLDAIVNEAWLIPSAQVRRTAVPVDIRLKSRTPYTGGSYEIEFAVHKLDVSRTYDYFETDDLDKEYKWYIGTYQNGMAFNLTTTEHRRIMCYYDINVDGVSVTLVDGENQKVITGEFILPVLGATDVADALGKISFYLGMSKDIIGGLASIFSAKTGAEAALKGVGFGLDYVNSIIGNENKTKAVGQSGQGNASFNYSVVFSNGWTYLNDRDQQYVYFPLVCVGFRSMDDEENKAAQYGVNYDAFMLSLSELDNYEDFVTYTEPYTFVQANARVAGVPLEAVEFIKAQLLQGIRVIYI